MRLIESDAVRFWAKVALPDQDGCMLWLAQLDPKHGYGKMRVLRNGKWVYAAASRVSCWLAYGPPPGPGYDASHSCRNRNCVAPEHLSWKTRSANLADRRRDGTDQAGSRNPSAKLSELQALQILRQPDRSCTDLAREFGVHRVTVSDVRNRRTWLHLIPPR